MVLDVKYYAVGVINDWRARDTKGFYIIVYDLNAMKINSFEIIEKKYLLNQ